MKDDETMDYTVILYEPRRKIIGLQGFQPGHTQTVLYSHISRLEA